VPESLPGRLNIVIAREERGASLVERLSGGGGNAPCLKLSARREVQIRLWAKAGRLLQSLTRYAIRVKLSAALG
jgi:hypothetical protein